MLFFTNAFYTDYAILYELNVRWNAGEGKIVKRLHQILSSKLQKNSLCRMGWCIIISSRSAFTPLLGIPIALTAFVISLESENRETWCLRQLCPQNCVVYIDHEQLCKLLIFDCTTSYHSTCTISFLMVSVMWYVLNVWPSNARVISSLFPKDTFCHFHCCTHSFLIFF